jgi:hypothetical protein
MSSSQSQHDAKRPATPDDGGESVLSGYSREYPTEPEKFENLGRRAPDASGEVPAEVPATGEIAELMEPTEEMIDEALEESFPASDPPSYMGSTGECVEPR